METIHKKAMIELKKLLQEKNKDCFKITNTLMKEIERLTETVEHLKAEVEQQNKLLKVRFITTLRLKQKYAQLLSNRNSFIDGMDENQVALHKDFKLSAPDSVKILAYSEQYNCRLAITTETHIKDLMDKRPLKIVKCCSSELDHADLKNKKQKAVISNTVNSLKKLKGLYKQSLSTISKLEKKLTRYKARVPVCQECHQREKDKVVLMNYEILKRFYYSGDYKEVSYTKEELKRILYNCKQKRLTLAHPAIPDETPDIQKILDKYLSK